MASSVTSSVYANVIEDVMNKCRDEFIDNGGPGESVLNELQALWELKMMQAGAIVGPIDRSASQKAAPGGPIPPNPVHDLNVPYEGTEEYETPTADLLFPPTPLQTPLPGTAQTPLPGSAQTPLTGMSDSSSLYNIHSGATPITPDEYSSLNDNGGVHNMKAGSSRPSPYMAPSPWLNQRPPLDVNVAYVEGREEGERRAPHLPSTQDFFTMPSGKRKREDFPSQQNTGGYIPQQDGAGDMISDDVMVDQGNSSQHVLVNATQQMVVQREGLSSTIPQLDGPMPDPYDDMLSTPNIYNFQGVANEDYNIVNTPAPHEMQAPTPAPAPQSDIADDDEDEPLNEDDDDDDLDDVDQGVDLNTAHLVLAQFDKVTRTKSRWKCNLKDGIMHINNKDILFNKATGEFEF
ncbi:transcription initiation factor IIA large subunit-like isoform X2 [Olea europaea var. sylvestris]|uniref:transcription initiation factor IIA large subunit-like isoform X2 n=1 Tax=Olea europaea var. sylvestris TaxID=158386 RepID=UPI000C1D45D3|nr:transcription initiation factor IIA large subunit-like isoform X2 [Olea europaea var. sylvestris]